VLRLAQHTAAVVGIVYLLDNQTLITGSYDKEILVWNMKTEKPVSRLTAHASSVICLQLTADR